MTGAVGMADADSPGIVAGSVMLGASSTATSALPAPSASPSSVGGSLLRRPDGTAVAGGGASRTADDSSVGSTGPDLAGATDLGTASAIETVRPDRLDLASNPSAVKLYRLALPQGHYWRLGLEVSAERDGGTLTSSLSLFDDQGRLIATASRGRPDVPADPYLFAGLGPGTYYVGVSDVGNVPDADGTYAPTHDGSSTAQPGGAFRLHVVADPADRATQVVGLQVDHADPLSPLPTGVTLRFSGSIDAGRLANASRRAATLVDTSGRAWPLTPIRYDESSASLSFAFDGALPAGRYSFELATPGALVDLAGLAPSAAGEPAGVLGTIDADAADLRPGDLGPLLPGLEAGGVGASASIVPGASLVEHFTVISPGVYLLGAPRSAGLTRVFAAEANPSALNAASLANEMVNRGFFLRAGAYTLVATNQGSAAVEAVVSVHRKRDLLSSVVENGVAQGPALGLRLISPPSIAAASPGPAASSPGAPQPDSTTGVSSVIVPLASVARDPEGLRAVEAGVATPLGPSGSFALVGSPVGRPSSDRGPGGVVGPSGVAGSMSLASNPAGMPPGSGAFPVAISPGPRTDPKARDLEPEIIRPSMAPGDVGMAASSDGPDANADDAEILDGRPLEASNWLDRAVAWAVGHFERTAPREPGPTAPPEGGAELVSEVAEASSPGVGRDEVALLASPLCVGVLAMIAIRYRRSVGAAGPRHAKAGAIDKPRPILVGPHRIRSRKAACH